MAANEGTPATAEPYNPLTEARITDSRPGSGFLNAGKTLGSNTTLNVQVTGAGGVPGTGVGAAVLNVTVTTPTKASFLTVWPSGATQPTASDLNWVAGQTVPNLVVVKLGPDGAIEAFNAAGKSTSSSTCRGGTHSSLISSNSSYDCPGDGQGRSRRQGCHLKPARSA